MIEIEGLEKGFGGRPLLGGVALTLAPGEVVSVQGPSGSGKSTLLRLIAGLERPDAGTIHIDGKLASDPRTLLEPHRRHLGFVFQAPTLWPHLNVADNIGFGLEERPATERSARVAELLARMEIAELARRRPDTLSQGQAQRVAIARALAPAPAYLLADEPAASLDPELKGRLLELLRGLCGERGLGLLYVTHDVAEVEMLGGRRLRLRQGLLEPV